MPVTYSNEIITINSTNQATIQPLVTSGSLLISIIRHMVCRASLPSLEEITPGELIDADNSHPLMVHYRPSSGDSWTRIAEIWIPQIRPFHRFDLMAELGATGVTDTFILQFNASIGVSAADLGTSDSMVIFGDVARDVEEPVMLI